eukprot:TRINITY_DN2703_c0_g1_i4.p1 TRINITY_DN2703_c0_g1~~TRINITY_DN2703_c0_g1_i4.p1  ORF type:complete len:260 (-),score=-18.20 TRINITY_DN2703_c0_g1_i4:355-1074(-)
MGVMDNVYGVVLYVGGGNYLIRQHRVTATLFGTSVDITMKFYQVNILYLFAITIYDLEFLEPSRQFIRLHVGDARNVCFMSDNFVKAIQEHIFIIVNYLSEQNCLYFSNLYQQYQHPNCCGWLVSFFCRAWANQKKVKMGFFCYNYQFFLERPVMNVQVLQFRTFYLLIIILVYSFWHFQYFKVQLIAVLIRTRRMQFLRIYLVKNCLTNLISRFFGRCVFISQLLQQRQGSSCIGICM